VPSRMLYGDTPGGEESTEKTPILSTGSFKSGSTHYEDTDEKKLDEKHVQEGTIWSSTFNLLNSAIGAGILSLPIAFKYAGLGLGLFLIVGMAAVAGFALLIIDQTAELYPEVHSYERLVSRIYGPRWGLVVTICIIASTLGTCAGFLIIIGQLLPPIIGDWINGAGILTNVAFITFLVSAVFIIPLTSLRHFNSMRFSSTIAVSSILYVIGVIVARSAQKIHDVGVGDVVYVNFSVNLFSALPLICFALGCHLQIVPIHNEMINNVNITRVKIVAFSAQAVCSVLYATTAIFGYICFLDITNSNILKNFPSTDQLANSARFILSFIIVAHYPSTGYVLRTSVDHLIFGHRPDQVLRRVGVAFGTWLCAYLIAIFVPNIAVVFGVLGATVSSMINFFFPAIFLLTHHRKPDWRGLRGVWAYAGSGITASLSIVMMFVSTATTIADYVKGEGGGGGH